MIPRFLDGHCDGDGRRYGAAQGIYGVAIQVLRKEVLSAPISFLALASLRQAVRLACRAAASLGGGAAGIPDAAGAAAGAVTAEASARCGGGAAANPATADRLRHTAAATIEKRMGGRIAPVPHRTDEARMKLA